eukprot:5489172-Pleurochrysis_carterae.AAC.4
MAKAQPVPRPHAGLSWRACVVSNADGRRERRGYSPILRRKGDVCCACWRVSADGVGGMEALAGVVVAEVSAVVDVVVDLTVVVLVAVFVPRCAWCGTYR